MIFCSFLWGITAKGAIVKIELEMYFVGISNHIIYVIMTEKMGSDEEKSDFAFLAFLVLYYINKACVKI